MQREPSRPASPALNLAAHVPRVPVYAFWEITEACNLRCIHCECDAGHRDPDELSTAEALALIGDLATTGCQHICLTGGEPLVRADWPIVAAGLRDHGIGVTLISNGLLVSEVTLATMQRVGVSALSLSLDGLQPVHDAIRVGAPKASGSPYQRTTKALRLAKSLGFKVAVITQVNRRNLGELTALHDKLVELGVDVWQVQLCMPLGRLLRLQDKYLIEPRDLPELERTLGRLIDRGSLTIAVGDNIGYYGRLEPKLRGSMKPVATFWSGCMAGCRVVALRSNGDVKGCPSHPREFVVGNIRQTPFPVIWGQRERFAYNTAFDETLLEGRCAECCYRRICRAGCKSMAYAVTGSIYDNPFCLQRAAETGRSTEYQRRLPVLYPGPRRQFG